MVKLRKNPNCKVCGPQPEITHLIDYEEFCGTPAYEDAPVRKEWLISPKDLAARLAGSEPVCLVDVREPVEQQVSSLPGAKLIPLGYLPERMAELDPQQVIILFCRTGARSMRAVQMLAAAGYSKVFSLQGGINAWARDLDPQMYQY
jgi:adenylyltransferase/sulfurtransferase